MDNKKIEKKQGHRQLAGIVISNKMAKTIVVVVENVKVHPKYHKRYIVTQKYKVHDEKGQYKKGDKVDFVECRRLSKDKKWRVIYK